MRTRDVVVAAFSLVAVSAVQGAVMFQLDVNGLTTSASAGFGPGYTGTVTVTDDADAVLADVLLDGSTQAFTGNLSSFTASFTFAAGLLTGGSYTVIIDDGSRLDASATPATGSVQTQVGEGMMAGGLNFAITFSGLVGGTNFAGVNVSDFLSSGLTGSFLVSSIGIFSQGGTDTDTNFEGFIEVPAPGAAGLLAIGTLLAAPRRRR
jgi:hypothetical protein